MNRQMDRLQIALANIDDDEKYLNSLSKLLNIICRETSITSDDKPISAMPQIIIKNNGD